MTGTFSVWGVDEDGDDLAADAAALDKLDERLEVTISGHQANNVEAFEHCGRDVLMGRDAEA